MENLGVKEPNNQKTSFAFESSRHLVMRCTLRWLADERIPLTKIMIIAEDIAGIAGWSMDGSWILDPLTFLQKYLVTIH